VKRALLLVPLALVALLAWWVWWSGGEADRVVQRDARGSRDVTTVHPGESLREVEEEDWDDAAERAELDAAAVLFGTVYDFNDRPVRQAEVAVLHPQPTWTRFTGAQGEYELRFPHSGRYLVEARLHLDLAPQRQFVEVPETGDPPRLDFHLKAAGSVFGEVVVGEGTPVWSGFVDIETVDLFGDAQYELDTDVDNGFFSFAWEPPQDVPLRLIVRSDDGFMEKPVSFKYEGGKLDVGRIKLTRFPTIRVRMRLPDGSWAKDVWAYWAEEWIANRSLPYVKGAPAVGWGSRIRVPSREGGTVRLVLEENETEFRILRDVDLVVDQLYEFEVDVRPGPIAVRGRLCDAHGGAVRARFRLGDAEEEIETGPEGWFSASVPHGGLFDARVSALLVPGAGWLPVSDDTIVRFVVDADGSAADVTQPLARRVLVLTRGVTAVRVLGPKGEAWSCMSEAEGEDERVHLSPPLPAGEYRWVRGSLYVFGPARGWQFREGDPGVGLTVNDRGWTVIDAR
jgi:hypothetical protein